MLLLHSKLAANHLRHRFIMIMDIEKAKKIQRCVAAIRWSVIIGVIAALLMAAEW